MDLASHVLATVNVELPPSIESFSCYRLEKLSFGNAAFNLG